MRFYGRVFIMSKKRTAITLSVSLVLAAILALSLLILPERTCFKGGDSYSFYLGDTSKDCREIIVDAEAAPLTRLFLSGVNGESATYSHLDIQAFLKEQGAEVVAIQEVCGTVNYYCRADLPYSIKLFDEEINLHICVRKDSVKVGTPIIFGGY